MGIHCNTAQIIRAHLADCDLTAARIAQAHNISVRQLYIVLARDGIGLGEWIRTERLQECRTELARPGTRSRTIASVARGWGFADATHFSRAFRQAYGLTPRQWRALAAEDRTSSGNRAADRPVNDS